MRRNDWLAGRIKELGKTGQGLANALDVNKARISEIIGGRRGVKADEVTTMATYLEMTEKEVIAHLAGKALSPIGQSVGSNEPPSAQPAPVSGGGRPNHQPFGRPIPSEYVEAGSSSDLPVIGSVCGSGDCDFVLTGEVIDRVRRLPALAGARAAFAVYIIGDSMSPRYDEGDLIIAHPGKPAITGCDVLVELQPLAPDGIRRVLLRTYRGKTASGFLLSQVSPESEQEISADQIKQTVRVLRVNELLGV